MPQEEYDLILDAGARVNAPYEKYYEQAKAASVNGKLKLVSERIVQPYSGAGFELDKGQVVRYELIEGAQIVDTFYMVRSRPMDEWADTFHSASLGAHTPYEGMHYYSNNPWCRPLLTFTRDTVDNENLRKMYGERAAHNFVLHNGACSSGVWESVFGIVNANSCQVNIAQGILEVAGEEVARRWIQPACFMHFQPIAFDKIPTALTYFSGRDSLKVGDFVELLAHDDLYVAISLCPQGDQHDNSVFEKYVSHPIRVAIYEGEDGPLETAPDPQRKTMNAVDFVLAGRPGMVTGVVGEKE